MINKRTAHLFRQPLTYSAECREACSYCEGMGLKKPSTVAPGATPIMSCNTWSLKDFSLSSPVSETKQFFVPGKYLLGSRFLEQLKVLPKNSHLIILMEDPYLSETTLDHVSQSFSFEIWVILKRDQDLLSILEKIKKFHEVVYFYCPTYDPHQDVFLTAGEVARVIKEVKRHHPNLRIASPPGVDVHNASFDSSDLNFQHDALVEELKKHNPKISVIIPTFNNPLYVQRVLKSLAEQNQPYLFEVIVVDDGSESQSLDSLKKICQKEKYPFSFRLLHYRRRHFRKMGDDQFRAGLARTLGVSYARGDIYSFLDSDIVVPADYISTLFEEHKKFDVVQIQRLYLTKSSTEKIMQFELIEKPEIFHPDGGYWKSFFHDSRPWMEMKDFWKYACTYGLSVKAEFFKSVNGFRSTFNSYGFEDTDLAFKLFKAGASFHKSSLEAYHLWHPPLRSEYQNSEMKRSQLLQKTGRIFFQHCLDPDVYDSMKGIFYQPRPWRKKIGSLFSGKPKSLSRPKNL